jgi:hypothetical protein
VNVPKGRLKSLIEHMCKVILELLGPLDSEEPVALGGETAELGFVVAIVSVAEFVGWVLEFEAHVAADASDFGVFFHMGPHFVDSVFLGFNSNVSQYTVLGIEEFAEALKEEHVGGEFSLIFMFDTKEHVIVVLDAFFFERLFFFFDVPGVLQVVLAHSHGVEDGLVLAGLEVADAEEFGFVEGFVDEFDFDVFL